MESILKRGARLQQQMADALTTKNAWESLHGIHAVPKTYVPPFAEPSPEQMKDKLYEM